MAVAGLVLLTFRFLDAAVDVNENCATSGSFDSSFKFFEQRGGHQEKHPAHITRNESTY